MSLHVAIGHSEDPDTALAVREAIAQCQEQHLAQQPPPPRGDGARAALVFMPVDADHATALREISRAFEGVPLLGCSTDGQGSSLSGYHEDSLCLLLLSSDDVRFGAAVARDISKAPRELACAAARAAVRSLGDAPPRLCLTMPESLTTSAVTLLDGLTAGLGDDVPVFGGTATDSWRFQRTAQFFGEEVLHDALPVLVLGGEVPFAHGVHSGWRPLGRASVVTRASGHVVHELDGRPALELYRHYLGAHVLPSGEYPVAVYEDGDALSYLRAPLGYDEDPGSVMFAGDVPEGARVRLTEASRDDILSAARSSIREAIDSLRDQSQGEESAPELALFFSCAARKEVLGTRTREELAALREQLPPTTPVFGFYAYGELGPQQVGGKTRFHNETFVTLLLGRRPR